jgi:kynureninase
VLGKVYVAKGADGTDGEQSIRAMLLDRSAQANARPELEIHADDVKCAHGCAIGELDANGLFYLASRGIAPPQAKALMLQAFIAEALDAEDEDHLRSQALAALEKVLAIAETLNIAAIRAQFPGLGGNWHYLDTGATAQKPQAVIDACTRAMGADYATVHRGVYARSADMTLAYEAARRKVAGFVGGREEEIVFTRGATEAINLVAQSWGAANLKAGDRILLSTLEHHSNIVPWQLLRDRVGIEIDVCPLTQDGAIDLDAAEAMLTRAHKLVALAHVSNVLGSVLDVRRAVALAQGVGAKILIDGCQAVPRMAVDVAALGVDFYAFSAHKLYGPTGIGALWARGEILAAMPLAGRRLDDRPGEF